MAPPVTDSNWNCSTGQVRTLNLWCHLVAGCQTCKWHLCSKLYDTTRSCCTSPSDCDATFVSGWECGIWCELFSLDFPCTCGCFKLTLLFSYQSMPDYVHYWRKSFGIFKAFMFQVCIICGQPIYGHKCYRGLFFVSYIYLMSPSSSLWDPRLYTSPDFIVYIFF